MIRQRRLALPAMKHPWILCIFIVVVALDFALMTANTGTYYEAIYTSNTKQVQDYRILQLLQTYFHQCSITVNCNYVVEYKKNGAIMYNVRSEILDNEETTGIWKKKPRQYVYRLFKKELNWNDARTICHLYGGDLASITSKEEEARIKSMISEFPSGKSFWCGLNDKEVEGKFVWSDGSEYSYKNWGKNEPNNMGDEDCMVLMQPIQWNDLPCEVKQYFICKSLVA